MEQLDEPEIQHVTGIGGAHQVGRRSSGRRVIDHRREQRIDLLPCLGVTKRSESADAIRRHERQPVGDRILVEHLRHLGHLATE